MDLSDVLYARKTGGGSGGGAEPLVIDLKEYYASNGSFNNNVLFHLMSAIEKPGEWVKAEIDDNNFALRDAFNGKKSTIMKWTYLDLNADLYAPASVVSIGDRAVFVSATYSTYLNGGLVDIQLAIAWDMSGSSNAVNLFIKATIATI